MSGRRAPSGSPSGRGRWIGARETRGLLARHGLRPRTALGQHFVVDPNTVRKVVRLAGVRPGETVLEVGAGLGALTLALAAAGARVVAVERDRALAPALEEVLAGLEVRVVWGDALEVREFGGATRMVSNLPYQIATPLLIRLLEGRPEIRDYTVMVQREVGERLSARPGDPAYGAVSAKVAYFSEASVAGRVSRRAFFPQPDVESVIVRLVRRRRPPVAGSRARIFAVVEAGFAQRRKTIRNALRAGGWEGAAVERGLARAGVAPAARAEELGLAEFGALARALGERRGRP